MVPLIQRAFKNWTVETMSPVVRLEANGFGSDSKTPIIEDGVYPWREDVLPVYEAIKSFVTEYISIYYKGDDELVSGDHGTRKRSVMISTYLVLLRTYVMA